MIKNTTDLSTVSWQNNGKLKLLIIVGTRPEIIRLAATVNKCRTYFDTVLAHTGQNYDYNLNDIFFKDLQIAPPDVYLNTVGEDLGATIGNIIDRSFKLMSFLQPDALLILGDTNSCLSAIPAKRLHIPIFHIEAGNRCKDECLPEETNRRIVDVISDVNLAYSEHARRWLKDSGLPPERTYVIGSPIREVLNMYLKKIISSDIHNRLTKKFGIDIMKGQYILLSAHREENIDEEKNFISLFSAVNAMAKKYDKAILYSCHPRSRKRLESSGFIFDRRVLSHEPLGFFDYNCLQMNSYCCVSDSGTLPEESNYFNSVGYPFPAVCIRTSTERPEALDKGCFILSGIETMGLLQSVDLAVSMNRSSDFASPVLDYADVNVSGKVVKIIQSYTGIIDKLVWRKGNI
jgi:UDP-N-acetylglucosamine 2-epimerase